MEVLMRIVNQEILETILGFNKKVNVVTSPAAINIILNMAASGSEGETLEQFLRFLDAESVDELNSNSSSLMALINGDNNNNNNNNKSQEQPLLSLVNAMFIEKRFTLNSSFKKLLRDVYKTDAWRVDRKKVEPAIDEVNCWAKYNTKGVIKKFLAPTVGQLRTNPLFFANYVHFKPAWTKPFNASMTRNDRFYLNRQKTSVTVPFMVAKFRLRQYYGSFDGFKVIRLFCGGSDSSFESRFFMDIILPHKIDGLMEVVMKLNSNNAKLLREGFKLEARTVTKLRIPKWKISYDLPVRKVIKRRGLKLPFSDQRADFSEMIESPIAGDLLYIRNILQKSFIEVDEGEQATSSIPCVSPSLTAEVGGEVTFIADHPFMFVVKETVSEAVILTGAVLNPRITS